MGHSSDSHSTDGHSTDGHSTDGPLMVPQQHTGFPHSGQDICTGFPHIRQEFSFSLYHIRISGFLYDIRISDNPGFLISHKNFRLS